MQNLRTITRTSSWTPETLRVLSAIVLPASCVSRGDPMGQVEGVTLDPEGSIRGLIVRLWENGCMARRVLVPLDVVEWYTEGFAPAVGLRWSRDELWQQRGLPIRRRASGADVHARSSDRIPRTLGREAPSSAPPSVGRPVGPWIFVVLGCVAGGLLDLLIRWTSLETTGSILSTLAPALLGLAAGAVLAAGSRRADAGGLARPSAGVSRQHPDHEPWVLGLERRLQGARPFERRLLHFSVLNIELDP